MQIGNWEIEKSPLLIAEIGNNHEGCFETALKMTKAAADAGAPSVKFQVFKAKSFISASHVERLQKLESFELSTDNWKELAAYAKQLGLLFIATPLDLDSAVILQPLVDAWKIASGDIDFYPLLHKVAKTDKPIILSTGASTLQEIGLAIAEIGKFRNVASHNLALLHCVTAYPSPPEAVHLSCIQILRDQFACSVGYSDHTLGQQACLTAIALGAQIIEKHFTLDKDFSDFRDHQLSADPEELKALHEGIQCVDQLIGKGEKNVRDVEKPLLPQVRRSLYAKHALKKGEQLSADSIICLRPSSELSSTQFESLIGRKLVRDIDKGEALAKGDYI